MCFHKNQDLGETDSKRWCDGTKAKCSGCTCRYPIVDPLLQKCKKCRKQLHFLLDVIYEEREAVSRSYSLRKEYTWEDCINLEQRISNSVWTHTFNNYYTNKMSRSTLEHFVRLEAAFYTNLLLKRTIQEITS